MTEVWIALPVAAVVGLIVGLGVSRLLRPTLAAPVFARQNYRDHTIPTAGGLVVVVSAALMACAALIVYRFIDLPADPVHRAFMIGQVVPVLLCVIGFGLLGLVDDVAGDHERKGFAGHVGSLLRGRLTTGGLKALGGLALAVVLSSHFSTNVSPRVTSFGAVFSTRSVIELTALIVLAANALNLFDRAPGRAIKFGVIGFAAVVALGVASAAPRAVLFALVPEAAVMATALALLVPDLRERVMLGDTGSNTLGAVVGLSAGATLARNERVGLLVVLIALNVAAELVSFSRVIDAVPPLRWFDRLGRLKADP